MRVAIVPHPDRPNAVELARHLVEVAGKLEVDVVAGAGDASLIDLPPTDLTPDTEVDMVIAIGGDGTVLNAVRVGLATDAPVFGINAGHLGFLADGDPADLESTVSRLVAGDWTISERMMVQASVGDEAPVVGLNDVVIEKMVSQSTVRIAVSIDDEPFITYRADGVVVATPTGSTAYNLSAGGPLVDPQLSALIMTPVAAHSLFSRALVFPPDRTLCFRVLDDRPVGVNVDGIEIASLDPGGEITVAAATTVARFVGLSGRSYPAMVKRKFSLE